MLIAIAGGIGSGKSVVSRILNAMGFLVYDCDKEAKRLMDDDNDIKQSLCHEIHPACVSREGLIDRQFLSNIVFNDAQALDRLNRIVHAAVREDIRRWCDNYSSCSRLFVETAILYQSGLDRMVDTVWEVEAPLDLRIERVMRRNSITREQVLSRIAAQDSFSPQTRHHDIHTLINDGCCPLLPQIEKILSDICKSWFKHGQ